MKDLERRVGRLESEKAATEDSGLYVVDDTPDGRMFYQGKPVIIRPAAYTLVIHKRARKR